MCCRLSIRVEVPWDTNLLRTLLLPFPPLPLPGPPPGAPLMFSDVDVVRHMVQLGCPLVNVEGADAYWPCNKRYWICVKQLYTNRRMFNEKLLFVVYMMMKL